MTNNEPLDAHSKEKLFPIVGVGASAGGLETFTELLKALPADTGIAFVLVQHLDPKHASILAELLVKSTKMPVLEVKDGISAEPNHVYVIPPNADMGILHGRLHLLSRPKETHKPPMPIDYFFRSLAQDQGNKAIGVVLSGTASDGSQGLKAIKAEGGITFAQDPETAKYDGMPRAAIGAGGVDFILTTEEIAGELSRIGGHPYVARPKEIEAETVSGADEGPLNKIFILLRGATGVDFTYYKQATVKRRIARRMLLHRLERVEDYLAHLRDHPEEAPALYDDMLITVTNFFRDPGAFDALSSQIFPKIVNEKAHDDPIRVWVAGCATGEEAYGVAISLLEFFEEHAISRQIQLFATDIHEASIEKARRGVYPESISEDVSSARLRRFFTRSEGGYQVNRLIRDMCVFARHDVTKDPPFSRLDLISCRNVLIYLGPVLQKKVLPMFHWALNPTGFLLLGASETIGGFTSLFDVVDKKNKIYARKAAPARLPVDFTPPAEHPAPQWRAPGAAPRPARPRPEPAGGFDLSKDADRIVLERYAPAGVIVDDNLEIVQFRGHTSRYLEPAPGKPSLNLLDMARPGMQLDLRAAVFQAKKSNASVTKERLRIKYDGDYRDVNIEVLPITARSGVNYYLVLFKDLPAPAAGELAPAKSQAKTARVAEKRELERLARELVDTKEYSRAIIEERDATNEELRAANEELQSSTEELQSINEELETAKEELQSSNEELTTVNEELQIRNLELTELSNDLANVLASTYVPIVILANDLRIRRVTPAAEKALNLGSTDIGRPITAVKLKVDVPDLEKLVFNVLDTMTIAEREIRDEDGRWYSLRVRPYKTVDNKIEGAVLSFVDIDAIKRTQHEIEAARDYAAGIVETVREPLIVLGTDLQVISANRAFYNTFKVSPAETEQTLIYEVGNHQWDIPELRKLLEEILPLHTEFADFEVTHDFTEIGRRTMLLNARRIGGEIVGREMILLAIEDITKRKKAERALAQEKHKAEKYIDIAGTMLVGIDANQNVILINEKGCEILGYPKNEVIGKNWFDNFLPAHVRDQVKGAAAKLLAGEIEPVEYLENPVLTKGGDEKLIAWHNAVLRDENDNIVAHLSSGEDITERKRTEEVLRSSEERFRAVANTAGDAVITINSADKVILWNPAAERTFGYTRNAALGKDIAIILPERYREKHKHALAKFLTTGRAKTIGKTVELEALRKDGSEFPIELSVATWKTGNESFFTGIFRDISERKKRETARLKTQNLSDALNDINVVIHSTLDFGEIMQTVVVEAVKALGSESVDIILRERGHWVVKYVSDFSEEQVGAKLTDEEAKHVALVARTKKPLVVDDALNDPKVDRGLVEKMGLRSFIVVPLVVRGVVIGAMAFHYRSSQMSFTDAQVDFAGKVGASVSLALENARLFAEEHNIAETLQEALLTMPERVEGLEFGHLYSSATIEAAKVGGDFFDLFTLEDGKVGIVIGDVSGKGLGAATLTSQVKNTIKAYSRLGEPPSSILARTNDLLCKTGISPAFVTAFFGILDTPSGKLTYCGAGHPPPFLKRASRAVPLAAKSSILGVFEGLTFSDQEVTLRKGDVLVAYTDGAIEARRGKELFGEARLTEFIKSLKGVSAGDIPKKIFDKIMDFSQNNLADDVALLTMALDNVDTAGKKHDSD